MQQGPPPAKNFKFPPKFEKGEKIGEGTYGKLPIVTYACCVQTSLAGLAATRFIMLLSCTGWVYHARSKESGKSFALKQFKGGRVSAVLWPMQHGCANMQLAVP